MSSSEIVALHTLLLPLRSTLGTRSPAHHIAESRHATDIAAVSTVCLCTANSGKSTLAIQVALARAIAGRDVWLVDGDRQGTSQTAVAIRAEAGREPGLACAQYVDGPTLRSQVQRQARKYDDVIIDAGGRDSAALRAALVLSDVLLVPVQPRSVDVWALADITALIDEARSVRDGLRAYAILNCADPAPGSTDNTEAAAALADYPQLQFLDIPIRRRKAIANATGQGLHVSELVPRDGKACDEITALEKRLFTA
jgi:chromosome partitioning protein